MLSIFKVMKVTDGVKIQVKVDIGFINEKPPQRFGNRPVYVCVLAETSDGRKMHFARTRQVDSTKFELHCAYSFTAV